MKNKIKYLVIIMILSLVAIGCRTPEQKKSDEIMKQWELDTALTYYMFQGCEYYDDYVSTCKKIERKYKYATVFTSLP